MDRRTFLSLACVATVAPRAGFAQTASVNDPSSVEGIRFSLEHIPFSCAGSFLTVNPVTEGGHTRLRLQTVRKTAATYRYQTGAWSHELFEFELLRDGVSVDYQVQASPERLVLRAAGCEAAIAFASPNNLAFTVPGGTLRLRSLRQFTWKLALPGAPMRALDFASGYTYTFTGALPDTATLQSSATEDALLLTADATTATATATLHTYVEREEKSHLAYAQPSLAAWMPSCPPDTDPETAGATRTAWFLLWNLRVEPSGGYTRHTVLSSKRSLSDIWSWDNLFHALALVRVDPEFAWDQLSVILDHQLPNGVLPDVVNDTGPIYGFRKPPIWAWAVARLLPQTPAALRGERLREVYPKLVAYHRWWFRERDLAGDGVPFYLTGNDSGWDNSTVFASGNPVQSPDLLAHLCVDAENLATCATRLGLAAEAAAWWQEADGLAALFERHFVRGDRIVFHELAAGGKLVEHNSSSLLTRLPLLLGARLSPRVRARIVADLRDPRMFFAASGPSSEALSSPLYDANGYWRGPVWGPSTLLLCEGLARCGEPELAATFARRYRTTVARRADFRENYDANTGEGRYDSGMNWAGASYLLLAHFLRPA